MVAVARSAGAATRLPEAAGCVALDIAKATEPADWLPHLAGIDAVVNCAGVLQDSPRDSTAGVHAEGAAALFAACEQAGVRRVVQISAIGVDRGAATAFARSKLAGDEALMARNLEWVILRPSVVVGRQAYGGSALFRGLAALPHRAARARTPGRCRSCSSTTSCGRCCSSCEPDAPSRVALEIVGPERLSLDEVLVAYRRWLGFGEPRFVTRAALAGSRRVSGGRSHRPPRLAAAAALHHAARARCAAPSAIPAPWTRLTGIEPRALGAALAAEPASVQERWFARLYFAKPLILAVLALYWIATGLVALGPAGRTPSASSRSAGFAGRRPAGCGGRHRRHRRSASASPSGAPRRPALWAALALSIAYLALATLLLPGLWADPLGRLAEGAAHHRAATWWRWRSWTTADDAYLALKYLHVIGAAVLLGTGAGIAFFMLLAHRTGEARGRGGRRPHRRHRRFPVHRHRRGGAADHRRRSWPGPSGYSLREGWIVLSIAALSRHRRLLAAGGVDADAHARPRRRRRARGRALPPEYHRLFRLWFAFGFPAFAAVLAIFWLMIAKPQVVVSAVLSPPRPRRTWLGQLGARRYDTVPRSTLVRAGAGRT